MSRPRPASHGPDPRKDARPFGKRGAAAGIGLVIAATLGLVVASALIAAAALVTMR